ncbi:MAG: hypothetical protein BGO38_02175 [Cellulomonas sp. 73-145]|uniref:HAD family hydrolase n=1 Tax=Cellulomonas sp. 73-145 TaxID=1895739 RepID=UPI0009270C7C|nr:HAD-IIB family hydrolase [Cellulomonas sp. 73-145]MBN9326828.1 HAD-IIB family hydrolase [Cellulomonas sp.]OJV56792.1 MAG: hypothetical protein BGO38_02175 [Cellulomonas sp. 73-145]
MAGPVRRAPSGDVVPPGTGAPRVVATDLDGTLLGPDGGLSARTRDALSRSDRAGVRVVAVTARPPRWLGDLAPALGGCGVAICANGAAVVELATLAVRHAYTFDDQVVRDVVARVRRADPTVSFALERTTGFAAEVGFRSSHPVPEGSPSVADITQALDGRTIKVLVRAAPSIDLDAFVGALSTAVGDAGVVSHSGATGLAEVSPSAVTKASTLAVWAAEEGVEASDVWAVGDAPNDLPMLAWAGRSFAVANAHPTVLRSVDTVLPSNADDGVAVLLDTAVALVPHGARRGRDLPGLATS